jgi:aerobic-type carbon monoxide dehydrogenase small subunit (CoxS/CutS family)
MLPKGNMQIKSCILGFLTFLGRDVLTMKQIPHFIRNDKPLQRAWKWSAAAQPPLTTSFNTNSRVIPTARYEAGGIYKSTFYI